MVLVIALLGDDRRQLIVVVQPLKAVAAHLRKVLGDIVFPGGSGAEVIGLAAVESVFLVVVADIGLGIAAGVFLLG